MLGDQERYARGFKRSTAKSNGTLPAEIRTFWADIASNYLFLLKREARRAAEAKGLDLTEPDPVRPTPP